MYIVRVTAIDKAGNVGVGECSTIVGNPKYRAQTQITNVPSFLVAKLDIVGGVKPTPDDESRIPEFQLDIAGAEGEGKDKEPEPDDTSSFDFDDDYYYYDDDDESIFT